MNIIIFNNKTSMLIKFLTIQAFIFLNACAPKTITAPGISSEEMKKIIEEEKEKSYIEFNTKLEVIQEKVNECIIKNDYDEYYNAIDFKIKTIIICPKDELNIDYCFIHKNEVKTFVDKITQILSEKNKKENDKTNCIKELYNEIEKFKIKKEKQL